MLLRILFILLLSQSICSSQASTNSLLGNSWNMNVQYSNSILNEYSVNVGRTFGVYVAGCTGFFARTTSLGVGYGKLVENRESLDVVKVYGDLGIFTSLLFISPLVRLEYNRVLQTEVDLIKPEIGFHFVFLDVTYSHAFNLNKEKVNPVRHGFNLRIRLYHNIKKWEDRSYKRPLMEYKEE